MKIHIAMEPKGINQKYHLPIWTKGVKAMGWDFADLRTADVIVMWGVTPPTALDNGLATGRPVIVLDFPYWNRCGKKRPGTESYKLSLNGQHPTPYVMLEDHPQDRWKKTGGPAIQPWRKGGEYIMVAGMGSKAAQQNGYRLGEWEQRMITLIREQTQMPILYRPKPKHPAPPVSDTIHDDGSRPLEAMLKNAAAVVCHHGNPTITALAMGVPIFMNGEIGAASHFASFDFHNINEPIFPKGREKFFSNIAYWQWTVDEIQSGAALQSYFDRGLLK